ncbi:MAG: hypothetical protein R8F63_01095 [Acidimicrobiales bacterium]|nr:hypothetical protein [Acidimicrobiales bacterium]
MFFPYRIDSRFRPLLKPFGVGDDDGVTLADEHLTATFGRARLRTPLANVTEAHVTRDYQWWKAIGMRLSFADDGLTFGTATHGGVCVHFDERVRRVIGFKDHSALTVTVDDLDGLAAAITDLRSAQ